MRGLLRDKDLRGDDAAWTDLVARYGGNGLALKVVGETIREIYGGDIAEFLGDVDGTRGGVVGGVRSLLDTQVEGCPGWSSVCCAGWQSNVRP